jgi:hypothetical protein
MKPDVIGGEPRAGADQPACGLAGLPMSVGIPRVSPFPQLVAVNIACKKKVNGEQ